MSRLAFGWIGFQWVVFFRVGFLPCWLWAWLALSWAGWVGHVGQVGFCQVGFGPGPGLGYLRARLALGLVGIGPGWHWAWLALGWIDFLPGCFAESQ